MALAEYLSRLHRRTRLGRSLRLLLRLVPTGATVPIMRGPGRGIRWIAGVGPAGYWLGIHEAAAVKRFVGLLRPGMVVYDIGAHHGYYSVVAARRVGQSGTVVAFEPDAESIAILRRHMALNHMQQVKAYACAVSDHNGTARFGLGRDNSERRIAPDGEAEVRTVTLDGIESMGLPPPDVVKMDIEGAETGALNGGLRLLAERHPALLLATHGEERHLECLSLLRSVGYHVEALNDGTLLATCVT